MRVTTTNPITFIFQCSASLCTSYVLTHRACALNNVNGIFSVIVLMFLLLPLLLILRFFVVVAITIVVDLIRHLIRQWKH